jgi:hypothetical protein
MNASIPLALALAFAFAFACADGTLPPRTANDPSNATAPEAPSPLDAASATPGSAAPDKAAPEPPAHEHYHSASSTSDAGGAP